MNDIRVTCPCGHDPERHEIEGGCRGEHDGYCQCRRPRWLAEDAAFDIRTLADEELVPA